MDGTTERVALAVGEQRRELGLSVRELERLSGVSRAVIAKIERGEGVSPSHVVRVASALTVLELYAEPPRSTEDVLLPRLAETVA